MKIKVLLGSLALISAIFFVSCGPNDAQIHQTVADELIDASLKVEATVSKGVVSLFGVVETDEQKVKAEDVVKPIKGVKSIVNNIMVTPPAPVLTPDDEYKILIEDLMKTAGFTGVNVSVVDSVVVLSGDVKKADEKKILDVVQKTTPKKLVNELKAK